jgi:hypothetical protein
LVGWPDRRARIGERPANGRLHDGVESEYGDWRCVIPSRIDIRDAKQAMALCKEGRMVYCPVCKKKYKVTWTPPGKSGGPLTQKLAIVNEKGEPCMFLAKLH